MRKTPYKYQQAKNTLMDIVATLPPNAPLPNRNQLAMQCGVARVTLERAISELIGEGVLVSLDGSGTYAASSTVKASPVEKSPRGLDEKTWALLLYSVTKGTAPSLLRGVEDFTHSHDLNLIVCNTENDPQREIDYLQRMLQQGVSGIVLVASSHSAPNWEIFDELKRRGVSIVTCSRQVPGHDFPGAFQNFFQSGFLAAQHLIQMGCQHIAYLATSHYSTIEDRLQGYLAAIDLHNSTNPQNPVENLKGLRHPFRGDIQELFEDFLRSYPQTDGIYVFNDRLAVILYRAMKNLGLMPGKDIRIIASDNSGFADFLYVPLTTIDFPAYDMGKLAAEQLFSLRNGEAEENCEHRVLSGEITIRESSGSMVKDPAKV